MWPRALDEIDKQLLVSQTKLKGVDCWRKGRGGPWLKRPVVAGTVIFVFEQS